MAEAVGTIRVDLFANIASWRNDLGKASAQLKSFARDAEKIATGFERTGQRLTTALTLPLVAFGGFATKAAAEAQDLQGAFNVSFGSAADAVTKWAEQTGDELGRSTQRIQQTAIAFNELFEDFAPNAAAAAELSKSFTVLTEDFAAFHNLSREQSQQVLLAGLAGSAKGLKKFGIDISDAALKAKAYELGIADLNAELTEQQKVLARASVIMAGTTKEQGEVSRSTGEAAEETIRARQAFDELLVKVGNELLPVFTELVSFVHDIIKGFNSLDKETQKNIVVAGALAAALGPVALTIGAVTKAAAAGALALRAMGVEGELAGKRIRSGMGGALASLVSIAAATGSVHDQIQDDLKLFKDFQKETGKNVFFHTPEIMKEFEAWKALRAEVKPTAAAMAEVADVTATELTPNVDELLKSFGPLPGAVQDNTKEFERLRDIVYPVNAAVDDYNENLRGAQAAGINAADASRAFGLAVIEQVGGLEKAQQIYNALPPAIQKLVVELENLKAAASIGQDFAKGGEELLAETLRVGKEFSEELARGEEDAQRFADDLTREFDPAAAFEEQMAKIKSAFEEGRISADVYKAAKDAAFAETPEGEAAIEAMKERQRTVMDLSDALVDAAAGTRDLDDSLKAMALNFIKDKAAGFLDGLIGGFLPGGGGGGGGIGNIFGNIGSFFGFGGSRDAGGPVYPGMAYRIGSGVEEIFRPSVPGTVERPPPGQSGAGGTTIVQNFNGTLPDQHSRRQAARQARLAIGGAGA